MIPNQPTNEPLKYGVSNMSEQHEPEMTQEEKDEQEWMNASLGKPTKRRKKESIKALIYRLMSCKNEDNKFACEVCDMNDICDEKYYNKAIADTLMIVEKEL